MTVPNLDMGLSIAQMVELESMTTTDLMAAARDETFASRVLFLALRAAQNVSSEAPDTPDDAVRKRYADAVIRGSDNARMIAAHVIASNPVIAAAIAAEPEKLGANVPDDHLEFALASIWTARAFAFFGREGETARLPP